MSMRILVGLFAVSLVTGCATYQSQVSHEVYPADETTIADDMVSALSLAYSPHATQVHLFPAKDKNTTTVFEGALREAGYVVEPLPTSESIPLVLFATSKKDEKVSTYCFQLKVGQICREYFADARPVGPFSTSIDLKPLAPVVEVQEQVVVGEGVVWFANDRGKLGPKGHEQTKLLVAEFLASGAQSVQVTGISTGRTEIGNEVLAEERAQSVAAFFFDSGIAQKDIQIQSIAQTLSNDQLPDRAAIVRFLREREVGHE